MAKAAVPTVSMNVVRAIFMEAIARKRRMFTAWLTHNVQEVGFVPELLPPSWRAARRPPPLPATARSAGNPRRQPRRNDEPEPERAQSNGGPSWDAALRSREGAPGEGRRHQQ